MKKRNILVVSLLLLLVGLGSFFRLSRPVKFNSSNQQNLTLIGNGYFGNIEIIWHTSDYGNLSFDVLNNNNTYENVFELSLNKGAFYGNRAPMYTFEAFNVPYKYLVNIDGNQVFEFAKNVTNLTVTTTDIIFLNNGNIVNSIPNKQGQTLIIYIAFYGTAMDDYDNGYHDGYRDGKDAGRIEGKQQGYSDGYDDGKRVGKQQGFSDGYREGLKDATGNTAGFRAMLFSVFDGIGQIFSVELLPGITIGAIILVPIIFGLLMFILGRRGGGD